MSHAPCSLAYSCRRWTCSPGKGIHGRWNTGPALRLLESGSFPSQQAQFPLFRQCIFGCWWNTEVRRKIWDPLFVKICSMRPREYCSLDSDSSPIRMHKMKRKCPNIGSSFLGVSIDPAVMDSCSVYPSVLTACPLLSPLFPILRNRTIYANLWLHGKNVYCLVSWLTTVYMQRITHKMLGGGVWFKKHKENWHLASLNCLDTVKPQCDFMFYNFHQRCASSSNIDELILSIVFQANNKLFDFILIDLCWSPMAL